MGQCNYSYFMNGLLEVCMKDVVKKKLELMRGNEKI